MRTEIASLGEFGLIDRLTEGIKLENESSKYGVGDDAAVLSYPSEKQVLVTTDLLEREKVVLQGDKDVQPDFSGKEYLLERQLKPEARKDIIEKLAAANIVPTSMMDISDGLSSELMHICKQSNAGCRVYEEHIPIDYQTAVMAEEFNMNLTTCALNGGEDYELLFTVSIADHEKISQMEGVRLIGHITKPELGCALITRDGQEFELKAQGWNPLKEDKQ